MVYDGLFQEVGAAVIVGGLAVMLKLWRNQWATEKQSSETAVLLATHRDECHKRREEVAGLVERVSTIQRNQTDVLHKMERMDDKLDRLLEKG